MARKVCTAEELERMTPAEQDAHFDASIVTNLAEVPAAFLDRVRGRLEERIANSDTPKRT
jgi:hypothetical protein